MIDVNIRYQVNGTETDIAIELPTSRQSLADVLKNSGFASPEKIKVKRTGQPYLVRLYTDTLMGDEYYTSFHLGNNIGLNRTTVQRYRRISEAMDKIDEVEPMLYKSIMDGSLNYNNTEILEIAQMDNKRIERIRKKKVDSDDVKMRSRECTKSVSKEEKQMKVNNEISLSMGIKKMPVYDPDMAIRGLTLTIPMWIAAIERAEQQTDMNQATDSAKMQLGEMLIRLDDQIQKALEVL